MYILRKMIETRLVAAGILDDECYFCSLSSRTLVYKGQLTPEQVSTGSDTHTHTHHRRTHMRARKSERSTGRPATGLLQASKPSEKCRLASLAS